MSPILGLTLDKLSYALYLDVCTIWTAILLAWQGQGLSGTPADQATLCDAGRTEHEALGRTPA